jgi:hypothetical protein
MGFIQTASPRGGSLERALRSLERAELVSLRFCSVTGGRHAHVALEEPREMALVGEAGLDRNRGEGRVTPGDLGRCPCQAETPSIFPDRDAVVRAEDAGEMGGMHADRRGHLAEATSLRPMQSPLWVRSSSSAERSQAGARPTRRRSPASRVVAASNSRAKPSAARGAPSSEARSSAASLQASQLKPLPRSSASRSSERTAGLAACLGLTITIRAPREPKRALCLVPAGMVKADPWPKDNVRLRNDFSIAPSSTRAR